MTDGTVFKSDRVGGSGTDYRYYVHILKNFENLIAVS